MLAKDTFKETLADVLPVPGRDESHRLGAAVFALLGRLVRELLTADVSLIVEGNFVSGTPALADLPEARIVQVHVSAPPELLLSRLLERDSERHPVHYDREAAEEIAVRAERGEWAALPLGGTLIEADTSKRVDEPELVERVRASTGL